MRKAMILIFFILFIGILMSFGFIQTLPKDECGVAIIQIVDKKTGQSANEVFEIYFMQSVENPYFLRTKAGSGKVKTNERGYWSDYIDPGEYFLWIIPDSNTSNFEMEPYPGNSQGSVYTIRIEKGKITKFIKKMERGCEMRILLTDPNGNKFIPQQQMNSNVKIDAVLISDGVLGFIGDEEENIGGFTKSGKIDEGEVLLSQLFPAKYILILRFYYGGYGKIRIENINVNRESIAEVKVVIDMNDRTGIEGFVKDENGNPISDYVVTIDDWGSVRTSPNGYYKIIGLKQKKYKINVSCDDDDFYYSSLDEIIEIFNNVVLRKDFIAKEVR